MKNTGATMQMRRMMIRTAAVATLAGLAAGGCSIFKEDRCVVPDSQYAVAKNLFQETGSLDLVRRQLVDLQWRPCRINEAIYRLQKEFEAPAVTPQPAPAAPQGQSGEGSARPRSPQS